MDAVLLRLRSRVEIWKGSDAWTEVHQEEDVAPERLAILLCDLWDRHWCAGAARRVDEMAPRINTVLGAARSCGVRIIHAPSETMAAYEGHAARRRALATARTAPPAPLALSDPPLPIDDSDGGCDSGEAPWYRAWTRQHSSIEIADTDFVSDDGREIYSVLCAEGIERLAIMGVHTNMCVLGRSFGIRQMARWGVRCLLVRDLTDAMYNPERHPYVSHARGTELVVEHIERHWCPSIRSGDLEG